MAKFIIIILMLINPLLSFPVSVYAVYCDKKNWRIYIFALSMFFAVMSYCYDPLHETDLVRYWRMVQQVSNRDFSSAFSYKYGGSGDVALYTFNLMAWVVGQIGDLHLLSAISTFIVYYIAFYITCYIGETSETDWKHTFGYIVFIMCIMNWYAIANNVRNILAFSVVGYAIFRDVYQKKKDILTFILYVIPIFLHPTALIFIAIRMTLNLTAKLKVVFLTLIVFATAIINSVYRTFSTINIPIFRWLISKAYYYFNDTSSEWGLAVQRSGFQKVQRIAYVSFAILMCVYVLFNAREERNTSANIDAKTVSFQSCAFMSGILTIGCVSMLTPGYWRFTTALVIFGGIIYIPYIKTKVYEKVYFFVKIYSYALSALGVAMNMWQITVKGDILSKMIFTCPFYIILKDLLYLITDQK